MGIRSARAAVLWTGGKDSAMAMHEAIGKRYDVHSLVTFAPPQADFLAHPLPFLKRQADALALPHHVLPVNVPFAESYEAGLAMLRAEMGVDCVVTGDIAQVEGYPNWIRERCRPVGMEVYTPLWRRDRYTLLLQLLHEGFEARISCVNTDWLDADWVGRVLNRAAVKELRAIGDKTGLDPCGEQGEYHTLVVNGPGFAQALDLPCLDISIQGSFAYLGGVCLTE